MKIATWNVNSLKVRLPHLLDWLAAEQPDVVCLQETKLVDEVFPAAALAEAGYGAVYAGQKTYNGVAILGRTDRVGAAGEVLIGMPGFADEQKRVLAATVAGVRIICLYIPNGQSIDSEKYQYKLAWLHALQGWLRGELATHPRLVVVGDFNIAPEDRDVHDPAAWAGHVLCSEPEREQFRTLLGQGLVDAFRLFEQAERSFSWWDYRAAGFRRDLGLRIDHILLTGELATACKNCRVDRTPRTWERPSDHAPVIAEISF